MRIVQISLALERHLPRYQTSLKVLRPADLSSLDLLKTESEPDIRGRGGAGIEDQSSKHNLNFRGGVKVKTFLLSRFVAPSPAQTNSICILVSETTWIFGTIPWTSFRVIVYCTFVMTKNTSTDPQIFYASQTIGPSVRFGRYRKKQLRLLKWDIVGIQNHFLSKYNK